MHRDHRDHRVTGDHLVSLDLPVPQLDTLEVLATLDHTAHRDHKASLEVLDSLDHMAHRDHKVQVAPREQPAEQVAQARKEPKVRKESKARKEPKAQLGLLVVMDILVLQVP